MTNQLRKMIHFIFGITIVTNVIFLIVLLVPPIGFNTWISYLVMIINFITSCVFFVIVFEDRKKEKNYLKEIRIAKEMQKAHNQILMDFYRANNILPQYDKNGKLRDLDSLLEIVQEFDKDGRPLPNIYDLLQVRPIFDKDGKEIPTILVIKHLVKKFKNSELEGFKDVVLTRKREPNEQSSADDKVEVILKKPTTNKTPEKKADGSPSKKPSFYSLPNQKYTPSVVDFSSGKSVSQNSSKNDNIDKQTPKSEQTQNNNQEKPSVQVKSQNANKSQVFRPIQGTDTRIIDKKILPKPKKAEGSKEKKDEDEMWWE